MTNKAIPLVLALALVVAGIFVAGAIIYVNSSKCSVPKGEEGILSRKEVETKVLDFVNQNILRGRANASLKESSEESGLYKIKFDIAGQEIESYATKNGRLFFPEGINIAEIKPAAVETGLTIGNFSVGEEEICKEDNKPLVYFFGSSGCPHCKWEHPIVEEVMGKFEGLVSFHNNMDENKEMDVFQKYSTGGIPTLVLGCRYYRVGSGEAAGKEDETKNLTALVCKLTNNQPAAVCSGIQDLIKQIEG